jgi:hypothetical protein
MPLSDLTLAEQEVVRQCLHAAAKGPFYPDWEFHTLFGVDRDAVVKVLAAWPRVDDSEEDTLLAINNSMNLLFMYPHGCEAVWEDYFSVPLKEIERVFLKWRGDHPKDSFEAMM